MSAISEQDCLKSLQDLSEKLIVLGTTVDSFPILEAWTADVDLEDAPEVPAELIEVPECLQSIVDASEALETQLEELECVRAIESLAERAEEVEENLGEVGDGACSSFEALGDRFAALADSLAASLDNAGDETREALTGVTAEFKESIDERVRSRIVGLAGSSALRMRTGLNVSLNAMLGNAERLRFEAGAVLDEVGALAGEELETAVRDTVRNVLESAVNELAQEAAESVVGSQVNLQITAALAPHLPTLIAARTLAPAVRQALEAMRMGF